MLKKKVKIVFRCDSSPDIGLGHLIRNLAIAEKLKNNNKIIFASIKDQTNFYIENNHFKIFFKKPREKEEKFLNRVKTTLKPDIIVIDKKYPYSSAVLNSLKQNKIKIVIIDNICAGMKIADEIIFPNAHLDKKFLKKYLSLKQIKNIKTGFKYVIVRDEILKLKNQIKHKLPPLPNIVVTTGGTDPKGVLLKLINWLKKMNLEADILILIGKSFKFQKKLNKIKENLPENFHILSYSPKRLSKGNIGICAFGMSIYEMIYLKIPTICIAHSKENAHGAKILKKKYKAIENVGYVNDVSGQKLCNTIKKLLANKKYFRNMKKQCNNLIDKKGVQRIAKIITNA